MEIAGGSDQNGVDIRRVLYAADVRQPMDSFIISESHLKELKSNDQRVGRLELKIQTLQSLLDFRKSRPLLEAAPQCRSKLVTLG